MATPQGETPADIFQEKFGEISPLIGKEPNFTTLTGNLFAKKLITQGEITGITTQHNLDDIKRGNALAMHLFGKIDEDEDPAQCLLKICEVFESKEVNNGPLRKLGARMREKLSTKTDQTSRHQGVEKVEDNGHDETDGGSQDGATQPPKQDGDKKKSDEPQAPPEWPYDKEITDHPISEPQDFSEGLVEDIEYLLLPATDTENEAVMYYLKQSTKDLVTKIKIDGLTIYTGYYGKKEVIVINTAPSKNTQGPVYAAIITTKLLDKVKSIKYIIAIGVCFGKDPNKQKLGEVIISTMILDFVCTRKGVWETYRQGGDYKVKDDIVKEFTPDSSIEMPHEIKVSKGPIITTPNLIDDPGVKKELFEKRSDALAGEMEGAGVMAAIEYAPKRAGSLDVIVIKGIGDWGDGNKKATEGWKRFAARAAAHYVHAVLDK